MMFGREFGRGAVHFGGFKGFTGPGLLIGGIVCVLFLLLLAVVLYILIRRHRKNRKFFSTSSNTEYCLEILKTRYAKGEITDEEFKVKKEALLK